MGPVNPSCSIEDCERPVVARGWCTAHWQRWSRHGDPLGGGTSPGAPLAFVEAVLRGEAPSESNGCVLWPYGIGNAGYPQMKHPEFGFVRVGAVILTLTAGPKPSKAHSVGHAPHDVCGSRQCVAPAHLSWQTPAEQHQATVADGTHRPPPRLTGKRNPNSKDPELVSEAVERVRNGEPMATVARSLGVSGYSVQLWAHQAGLKQHPRRGHTCGPICHRQGEEWER